MPNVEKPQIQPIDAVHEVLLNILSEQQNQAFQSELVPKMPRGSRLKKNKTGINIIGINPIKFDEENKKNSTKKNKKSSFKAEKTEKNNLKKENKTNLMMIDDDQKNDEMDYELHAQEQLDIAIEYTASVTNTSASTIL
ncbi:unnamed protein product [Rotaria sp. Silwood2]|nr:unnamed protein product [Rotaria sp. Silwood2]CAF4117662.1 unnamed protein product [Rotaria sp. Silwood2]